MKKNKLYIILLISVMILFISCIYNISSAASFGSVDEIDESKYPGVKSELKQLQQIYPNITVLYTGLDWNKVIYYEHDETHGRNLVETSMGDEWICFDCKNLGKWYDSGLYCASEEAVRYVMDPRNYLNKTDLFQFQKLYTAVGTNTNEISIILQMQQVNYLKNDWDAICAFADVARENNLNAYHLVTRVIQEQGRTGTSTLSSGLGYTGNGYQNYGYGLYNLFSIGATRKSTDPAYQIYINALDRAAIEGWNTRAASIRGGGRFVGNNYINVGQNTLYLQKFSVYNTNGQLYWHQYMQNLFGAQNEAKILYSLYQATGIQDSKDFEFVIPLYENMPKQKSKMPGSEYDGYVNSFQYGEIEKDGDKIVGKLVVQEYLKDENGVNSIQAEPTVTPKIRLKSDNGTYIDCDVTYKEPYIYQYSISINQLDITKEYYIEVQSADTNNISNHTTVTKVPHENQDIGQIEGYNTYMLNNVFTFTYDGMVNSYPYTDISINGSRMEGLLVIQEWLNGTKQIEPTVMPKVFLVADDGSKVECEVGYVSKYIYGFSNQEKYIDKTKKYRIQVESGSSKNISANNTMQVSYDDMNIGTWGIYTVQMEKSKLNFVYEGYMLSKPFSQEITLSGNKISGELVVQEWLNGTKQMQPITIPKLVVKNDSSETVAEIALENVQPYLYNYEIDTSLLENGNYILEVQGTNLNNISNHQNIQINYDDQETGSVGNNILKIEDGNLIKEEKNDKYDGYMLSYPFTQSIATDGNKISGKIVVQEWLNGTKQMEPKTLPRLVIRNISHNTVSEIALKYVQPYLYSYERDTSLLENGNYILEVQGTNPNNISNHQNIQINYENQEIGNIRNIILKIEDGKLIKEEKNDKYDGYMLSYPFTQSITVDGNMISGKIVVQEWLNGTKQMEPKTLPKLVIKDASNEIVAQTIFKYVQPYLYSYEIDISVLEEGNYTLEVQGTNPNNISNHQNIQINYDDQEIGNRENYVIKILNSNLNISK